MQLTSSRDWKWQQLNTTDRSIFMTKNVMETHKALEIWFGYIPLLFHHPCAGPFKIHNVLDRICDTTTYTYCSQDSHAPYTKYVVYFDHLKSCKEGMHQRKRLQLQKIKATLMHGFKSLMMTTWVQTHLEMQ